MFHFVITNFEDLVTIRLKQDKFNRILSIYEQQAEKRGRQHKPKLSDFSKRKTMKEALVSMRAEMESAQNLTDTSLN